MQPGLAIQASLDWDGSPILSVSDDGAALGEHLVSRLFQAPVASANGLGVGLYQAARLAQDGGYRLMLSRNQPGQVRFTLAAAP
jgi:C4-dicarboxylate-specific signal transduction histidine kinase